VEDDELIRKEGLLLLEKFFKQVHVAVNGKEGLDLYRSYKKERDEYFDLVITDINMPIMNGIEMIKDIKRSNQKQPIIVISAHDETKYLIPLVQLGVNSFLLKPIDTNSLTDILYKSCQAIHDHKIALAYNGYIERLNTDLTSKNKELAKSLRQLEGLIHLEQLKEKQYKGIESNKKDNLAYLKINKELYDLISVDLPELIDLCEEISVSLTTLSTEVQERGRFNEELFEKAVDDLNSYALKISSYTTFNDLSESIKNLAKSMKVENFPEDKDRLENIFVLLETFLLMLSRWNKEWESGNVEKINFFYKSVISDIHTIINVLEGLDKQFDEIEFF
jgi:YesN/AraC family two-component response regulator